MEDEETSGDVSRYLVATIISGYVKHNTVATNDLPAVIASVYQALSGLGGPGPVVEPLMPAVPVRQSVGRVCRLPRCGFRSQMLRRHLRLQHGLERAEYYARWRLPPDHPITAPGYSARRSAMAKELGLGRGRQVARPVSAEPEPTSSTKPRRRSRARAQEVPST
jgi:predicted transcriptional regulator